MKKYQFFMVFDVESIGLHGDAFAVGFVVIDTDGAELESGVFAVDPGMARGRQSDRAWVRKNIAPIPYTHDSKREMRDAFWVKWREWADRGAALVSDCAWPVEANFLSVCVRDEEDERKWNGPYPLLDLSSVFLSAGMDPVGTHSRTENELPAHHPLSDARQSARLLIETLRKIEAIA